MQNSAFRLSQKLAKPAKYFPPSNGKYEVVAGLSRLGHDFGNGAQDKNIFQFDEQWETYRHQKLASRQEDLDKYYLNISADNALRAKVVHRLINTLVAESPQLFRVSEIASTGNRVLDCLLTREAISVDGDGELLDVTRAKQSARPIPEYEDAIDAIVSQLQEDVTIMQINEKGGDRMVTMHVCYPNHWSVVEKIGKSFVASHTEVPHFEKLASQSSLFVSNLTHRGPFVRFAWGLATDTRLNHHAEPPENLTMEQWKGRGFNDPTAPLYMRIERQVVYPFPEHNALMFTIRTYHRPLEELTENESRSLFLAISDMDEKSARYKGLYNHQDAILQRISTRLPNIISL